MTDIQTLWDWRRQVADLYAAIRHEPDPHRAWTHWRDTRDKLFASHPDSPLDPDARAAFTGIRLHPYDPTRRFMVQLEPVSGPPSLLPAGDDGTVSAQPFARTVGLQPALGGELTLFWLQGYGGGVFLPFTDAGSGRESYGGGRYLLDTIKGADLGQSTDGRTVIDFNFAYAPSCAHSKHFICPLAPASNRLPTSILAGERL